MIDNEEVARMWFNEPGGPVLRLLVDKESVQIEYAVQIATVVTTQNAD